MRLIKKLHVIKGLVISKITSRKYPAFLTLMLTTRCNMRCKYCDIPNHIVDEMDTSQILSVINQLPAETLSVTLYGGEPLLRKDIRIIIESLKKKDVLISVCTNGHLMESTLDDLKGINLLLMSLDGPENMHNLLRGKGSYKKVIKAVKLAKERGLRVVLSSTITKMNISGIDFLLKKARELGVKLSFSLIYNSPLTKNNKELYPTSDQLSETIKKILVNKDIVINSKPYLELLSTWPNIKKFNCVAGKLSFEIYPNGDLYPCYYLFDKVKPSNVLKEGLLAAINKIKMPECIDCYSRQGVEYALAASFNIPSMINQLKIFKRN